MNRIFIEAKNNKTPEYYFLQAVLSLFFPDKEVSFVFMDGIGNLFGEAILNQISLAQTENEQVLVMADADTTAKGWGFQKRKAVIERGMSAHDINVSYFLYPDNQNDGDVENLMEQAARRDLHSKFFDCFEDYEKCISGVRGQEGLPLYNIPNLKGKLHTYISAQILTNAQRRKLGAGDWLFNDPSYWNLNIAGLQPLKDFFALNLK